MSELKDCPVSCGRKARDGHLMCPRCWSAVPQELRLRVWNTWRLWKKELGNAERMLAYTAASDAAIASVT